MILKKLDPPFNHLREILRLNFPWPFVRKNYVFFNVKIVCPKESDKLILIPKYKYVKYVKSGFRCFSLRLLFSYFRYRLFVYSDIKISYFTHD